MNLLTLATDVTVSGAGLAMAASILGAVWILVQVGDRLWKRPAKIAFEQSARCGFDHERLIAGEGRMEDALTRLANSQTAVLKAVEVMAQTHKHEAEIAKMRHTEVMKTLDLIERKFFAINNTGS